MSSLCRKESEYCMAKQMITECDWLYAEWHWNKNKGLNPAKISVGSNLKVWWKQHYSDPVTNKEYDFEWQAEIRGRFRNHSKCPYLTGNAVYLGFNDLKTKYPDIAAEWHPVRNGSLTPDKVLPASNKEVWWLLSYDDPNTNKHFDFEWRAPVKSRTKKDCGCPFLTNKRLWKGFNDLATLHPNLALEWNVEKNGLKSDEVLGQSNERYWWVQYYYDDFTGKQFYFEWEASINSRANGKGNPYLAGRLLFPGFNDLETRCPDIAAEWHPTRNGSLLPNQFFAKDSRRVWWYKKYYDPMLQKEFEFEWETTVGSRTAKNSGCPFLSGRSLCPGFNDLETRFPNLAKEWDYEKNDSLTPDQVMPGSRMKVWWKIEYTDPKINKKHILSWRTSVVERTKGYGCPYLSNKKVIQGLNDLATTHPFLAVQWHPTKNGSLKPEMVTYGSSQQVWWLQEYYDSELNKTFQFDWKASVNARTNRDTGCPYLSNTSVWPGFNDLQTRYPEISAQWDYEKNGNLTPDKVIATSQAVAWWKIPYTNLQTGQLSYLSWKTRISNRTVSHTECPYLTNTAVYPGINDLQTRYPDIAAQWHPFKNGTLKPDQVFPYDKRNAWWYLPYDDPDTGKHFDFEWECTIQSRVANRTGCPYLSGASVWPGYNDLSTTYPEIAGQWNYEKNGELTPEMVTSGSNLLVWWLLPYNDPQTGKHFDFDWQAVIESRTTGGNGCPYPTNDAVWVGYNDLATTHPEIAAQWHPTKNGSLTPEMVTAGSNQLAWWFLPYTDPSTGKTHYFEWVRTVTLKVRSLNECPYTAGHAVWTGYNDLQSCFPDIAEQWSEKNRFMKPDKVYKFSKMKAWWKCPVCEAEWRTSINSRTTRGTGCPKCALEKRKFQYLR